MDFFLCKSIVLTPEEMVWFYVDPRILVLGHVCVTLFCRKVFFTFLERARVPFLPTKDIGVLTS